MDTIIHWLL